MVAFAFGLAAASLFPALLLGIFSLRMNAAGAISGMLTGLLFTLSYIVAFKGVFMEPLFPNTAEARLLGISPEGIGAVGMVLNSRCSPLGKRRDGAAVAGHPGSSGKPRIPRGADQAKAH